MPTLNKPQARNSHRHQFENLETAIRCADIYLWLSQRERFAAFARPTKCGPSEQWSRDVDAALQKQVDTTRRCSACGKKLALDYQFNV